MNRIVNGVARLLPLLLSYGAAVTVFAAGTGTLPIVGTMTAIASNIQGLAYPLCVVGVTLACATLYGRHHDWSTIGTTATGVGAVSALVLAAPSLLATIPGAAAITI